MPEAAPSYFTTVFPAAREPRKVKRNRSTVSCIACQKRKSRCDRRQPCGACEKRGGEDACRFGPASSTATNGGALVSKPEVQSRLTKLEELVRNLAESQNQGSINECYDRSFKDRDGIPRQDQSHQGDETWVYQGATSWSALVDSIRDIQSALDEDNEVEASGTESLTPPDVVFGNLAPISTDEILKALPPRPDVDKLITVYFSAKFVAVPILHTGQFQKRYEKFWDAPEATSLLWISILFSILGCGTLIAAMRGTSLSHPASCYDSKTYISMAARCLVAGQYLKAKPLSVEAIVMHAHSRNFHTQDKDSIVWTLYSVAIRLAQRQGYHRDASKVSFKVTPFEAEMRRRVWFAIESYDLLFSQQHGMPFMTHEDMCDTGHPLNIEDEDFDEDSVCLVPRPPTDPSPILAYITKSQMLPLFRKIQRHALGIRPESIDGVYKLGKGIDDWYQTIPQSLKYRPIRDTSFTDANHTIFHRLMLELMYQMSRCMLYRSFLSNGHEGQLCTYALDICRDAALKMFDMHIEIDRDTQSGGRLYEDRYMVSSLTLHGFLVAAMIICLELNDSANMRLAPQFQTFSASITHTPDCLVLRIERTASTFFVQPRECGTLEAACRQTPDTPRRSSKPSCSGSKRLSGPPVEAASPSQGQAQESRHRYIQAKFLCNSLRQRWWLPSHTLVMTI